MTHPGFTNPETQPHSTLNAAAFPRTLETDLPSSQRASFSRRYPHGLPSVYKMIGPHDEGVPLAYLEDNLPIGFYTNPPPNAPAAFSTAQGERKFRKMSHILPRRRIHLWDKDQLQAACNSTRKTYWALMKNMTKPYCWDDLWTYYDAFDLYHYGALNLWNLINQLYDENVLIYDGMERECANHIGQWADEWIGLEKNQRRLREWTGEKESSIVFILSDEDRKSMGDIPDDMIPLLASALKARRHLLLTGVDNFRKNREGASDVMAASGEQVFDKNALPSPPAAEDHQCSPTSKNAPAPCFQKDGRHYYLPDGMGQPNYRRLSQSSAVEALQKSAAAAITKRPSEASDLKKNDCVIIAHGTRKLPITDVKNAQEKEEVASEQLPRPMADGGEMSTVGDDQQSALEEKKQRTPNQPDVTQINVHTDNNVGPVLVTRGQTSPSPMPRKSRLASEPEPDEKTTVAQTQPSRQFGPTHVQHVKRASISDQTGTGILSNSPLPHHPRPATATASGQPA
ncbi:hypothetical protein C2857_003681 [Epichloe festucae Fl1]|uniref:Uncharacterized protein n=1 Tax=Epichloe festucae (strain Fl1) TaxID=877507 RepID=A0A7S9KP79_EPIFF|nr:hypothetical protein C2857_003681 [Epichloe festucae Fl1]